VPPPTSPASGVTHAAALADPCRHPKAFAETVRKLERSPQVEVSRNARRALRLLAQKGAENCHSSGAYLDQVQTITKK
jgi:hypothetical protein